MNPRKIPTLALGMFISVALTTSALFGAESFPASLLAKDLKHEEYHRSLGFMFFRTNNDYSDAVGPRASDRVLSIKKDGSISIGLYKNYKGELKLIGSVRKYDNVKSGPTIVNRKYNGVDVNAIRVVLSDREIEFTVIDEKVVEF